MHPGQTGQTGQGAGRLQWPDRTGWLNRLEPPD
jgi:hypothetical protein